MVNIKKSIKQSFDKSYLEKYPDKEFNDYQYYSISKMLDESLHSGLVLDSETSSPSNSLNTPLLSLMHDTAHDLDILRNVAENISKILKERKESDSRLYVAVEYLKSSRKNIMDKLDEYYIKTKSTTPQIN